MNRLDPDIETIMKLLLEQGAEAAKAYVNQHIVPDVEKAKKAFETRQNTLSSVNNIIFMATGNQSTESSGDNELPMDVRGQVLAIAAEIARGNDGIAALNEVVREVANRGLDLKSSRPGTSIANILFRAPFLWQRMSPGIFKLIA